MTIEEKLKEKIITEYKNLKNFTDKTGLKYTTVDSMLKRGIRNSNIQNVINLCEVLHISVDELVKGNIVPVSHEMDAVDLMHLLELSEYHLRNQATLDGKPLSESEVDFITGSLDLIVEQVRKNRNRARYVEEYAKRIAGRKDEEE